MTVQAMVAVFISTLTTIAIIVAAVSAAAAVAWVTAALFTAIGIVEKVIPGFQLLEALALTPNQVMIMAAMQTGSLATITGLMQEVNLVMITATL
ncbi:hypothetical protein [Pseudomonas sp. PD9R]|uniref:hypothetical protein n=1 Tax=Pseudomonas sp. PD9R TaxID=2853534 RepID=UPI001C458BB9|nr:hypothetical protein [Pseudomonas sp. PD9R]MBV6824572.1 hypothetical protein [Pseudomonas sp. PD9R]